MSSFANWLEQILEKDIPPEIRFWGFEIIDTYHDIWQIGCYGVGEDTMHNIIRYSTKEMSITIRKKSAREIIQSEVMNEIKDYMQIGKYAKKLRDFEVISVGFWDEVPIAVYQK